MRAYSTLVILTAFSVFGQTPLAFEVASIKPNKSGGNRVGIIPYPGGKFTANAGQCK